MKIIFIFSCSGMFRNVSGYSGMFRVVGFIDGRFSCRCKAIRYSMNIALESELRLSSGSNKHTMTNRTLKPSWTEWNILKTAVDKNNSVILLLLDLTAAFDTLDHVILLSRMSTRFGVKGSVWTWLKFFLTSPTQFVSVKNSGSSQRLLERGVGPREAFWGLVRQSSKPRRNCTEQICS